MLDELFSRIFFLSESILCLFSNPMFRLIGMKFSCKLIKLIIPNTSDTNVFGGDECPKLRRMCGLETGQSCHIIWLARPVCLTFPPS